MDEYYFVFLRRNESYVSEGDKKDKELGVSHRQFMKDQAHKGNMLLAGPLDGAGGLYFFNKGKFETKEKVLEELNSDASIGEGVLIPEVHLWYVPDNGLIFTERNHRQYLASKVSNLLERRNRYFGPSLSLSYQEPVIMVRGKMQYLIDSTGREYLDFVNNVPIVGHSNPEVVKEIGKQSSLLNTNSRYLHSEILEYAEALVDTMPDKLSVCYFVNSGSEANELALRLARNFTKRKDVMVLEQGYHGNTTELINISSHKFDGEGGFEPPDYVHKLPTPDCFRGEFRGKAAGNKYIEAMKEEVDKLNENGIYIGTFIAEPIMGTAGQIVLPSGYLRAAYDIIHNQGGVCISDEVQVGFGRLGEVFWGFELDQVIPDIVSLGKPIGNGHPLGAVITTKEIANAFNNGMEFFSTTGGNPVSAAIGKKVLSIIKSENLQSRANELGSHLIKELQKLRKDYPIIGEVRGKGLFIGIEIVKKTEELTPDKEIANYIVERLKELGILVSADGPDNNVIKIKPPLIVEEKDVNIYLSKFKKVLEDVKLEF